MLCDNVVAMSCFEAFNTSLLCHPLACYLDVLTQDMVYCQIWWDEVFISIALGKMFKRVTDAVFYWPWLSVCLYSLVEKKERLAALQAEKSCKPRKASLG